MGMKLTKLINTSRMQFLNFIPARRKLSTLGLETFFKW